MTFKVENDDRPYAGPRPGETYIVGEDQEIAKAILEALDASPDRFHNDPYISKGDTDLTKIIIDGHFDMVRTAQLVMRAVRNLGYQAPCGKSADSGGFQTQVIDKPIGNFPFTRERS